MSDKYLEDWQREAVLFIERYHGTSGSIPPDDDIIEFLKFTKKFKNINYESIEILKASELFKASMETRGLVVNYKDGELRDTTNLTARQMSAASVMLDVIDRRSDEKKLRDLGISTEEFRTWMQDAAFAKYMQERSEVLIANSTHEAHMGLVRGLRQGNTSSIKLYYELTGRYNPNEENNVNIRILIGRVLEAIQKHVKNPDTLNSLAIELSQLAIEAGSSPVAKNPIVPDSSTTIKGELS